MRLEGFLQGKYDKLNLNINSTGVYGRFTGVLRMVGFVYGINFL